MRKKDGDKLFWISYSDLMTSLFFVMMILFAIMTVKFISADPGALEKKVEVLTKENKELKDKIAKAEKSNEQLQDKLDKALITLKDQQKYIDIVAQFKPLKESGDFVYMEKSGKYVAKDFLGIEIFDQDKGEILPQFRSQTIEIGRKIEVVLKELQSKNPDYTYVLVIEGNTANDPGKPMSKDAQGSYKLSYERALAVYTLWNNSGINLRKYNTEVLISGSGMNGWDRDPVEKNNKRFGIQIIPRIKTPEITK